MCKLVTYCDRFFSPPVRMHRGLLCIAFCLWLDHNSDWTKRHFIKNHSSWSRVKMGRSQRSLGSRSNVTSAKFTVELMILAGGLTSTSSCIFYFSWSSDQLQITRAIISDVILPMKIGPIKNIKGVTANVLVLLHYAIHLSITNTSNCHYI